MSLSENRMLAQHPDLVALEEEFFRVEGRPEPCASRACAYVARLEVTPTGEHVSAAERAALWYLAWWAMETRARFSFDALAMHLDCYVEEARRLLASLIRKGVLTQVFPTARCSRSYNEHVVEFRELMEGENQG